MAKNHLQKKRKKRYIKVITDQTLRAQLPVFPPTHYYSHLCEYHGWKEKAMLDNGIIKGITLEPLRLQKGFFTKAIMQLVCLRAFLSHNFVSITLKVNS